MFYNAGVITILYHKVRWTPELSVCVERENVGVPKQRAFHIDALCFKVIGIPVSPDQNEPVKCCISLCAYFVRCKQV